MTTGAINTAGLAAAHKALMSELFLICQPDRGDVFGFMDDHPEALQIAIAAYLEATRSTHEPVARQWRYSYDPLVWSEWQATRRLDADSLLASGVILAEQSRPLFALPTQQGFKEGVEAAAKLVDEWAQWVDNDDDFPGYAKIAKQIRALSEQPADPKPEGEPDEKMD